MGTRPELGNLVVVIPGIGGSVLFDGDRPVWGRGVSDLVMSAIDSDRLNLAEHPHLEAVGLIDSMLPLAGWALVHGYDDLRARVRRAFANVVTDDGNPRQPDDSANLVMFPYDFRHSIACTAAHLDAEVHRRLKAHPSGTKVFLIGHSLGGLVARHWLGPGRGWKVSAGLVTLGTPHRGAPKALDWLVNGARIGGLRLPKLSSVIAEWPSVHELLPRYPMMWAVEDGQGSYRYPRDFPPIRAAATRAFAIHEEIERAWPAVGAGVPCWAAFGGGHPTLRTAVHRDGKISVSKRITPGAGVPPLLEPDLWAGDGTVPQESAIPIEMSNAEPSWRPTTYRHSRLANSEKVVEALKETAGAAIGHLRGAGAQDGPGPVLALDLDDAYRTGQPIVAGFELRGLELETPVELRVAVSDETGRPVAEETIAWGPTGILELGPLPAGIYGIAAAADTPQGPIITRDHVAVVGE